MINLAEISRQRLNTQPFSWAEIGNLFSPTDATALVSSYPHDNFKTVEGHGGEKSYYYEARALIGMGSGSIANPERLSKEWLELARDLLSMDYREAMSFLTGYDLSTTQMEVNVCHYGPGAHLGPHCDLPEKIVTHVFYFNEYWDQADGGCLAILNSADPNDVAAEVLPTIGNSAAFLRSENSWHEVTRVKNGCTQSRRSMTVTFYPTDSISSMWPPGDTTLLQRYIAVGN
ncbi:MAG: 2OG-Fe(II) oxygenase [Nitrosospira sp.]|nr:2OG-Fe(II) oxygenase [Nitrosospira sp.]